MSPDGKKILANGQFIFKDATQPVIEGPKLFKKDGYYYILSPAGGVPVGWQVALRSKNIYGPYEAKNIESAPLSGNTCFLKVTVGEDGLCRFSYSTDNVTFQPLGSEFKAWPGR